jgi:hypothetical protein
MFLYVTVPFVCTTYNKIIVNIDLTTVSRISNPRHDTTNQTTHNLQDAVPQVDQAQAQNVLTYALSTVNKRTIFLLQRTS